jgi:hypothetical protein
MNPLSFGWLGAQTNTEGMGMKKIRNKFRLRVYKRANEPYGYLTAAFFNTYFTMTKQTFEIFNFSHTCSIIVQRRL